MRRIITLILVLFSLFSCLTVSAEIASTDVASVQAFFQSMGSKQTFCEQLFEKACEVGMDFSNTTGYSAFVEEFGDAYLLNAYCYYDEKQNHFYIKMDISFGGQVTTKRNFYFEIVGDNNFNQLDGPSLEVDDKKWTGVFAHTEKECYDAAISYMNKQRWKDPSSVTIYGYTVAYGVGTYTFYVDYAAKNSFGGNTRSIYIIEVDASSNEVTSAFSTR